MTAILWISLILLAAASVLPKTNNSRFLFGSAGWVFLSIYWSLQPEAYIGLKDYVNAFLVIAAAAISLFIAYIILQSRNKKEGGYEVFISLSRAASVGGLLYFLFAEVGYLNTGIISTVTKQAIWVSGKFGVPVTQVAWNQFAVNGLAVEIILACTAIESIALFSGIISSAEGATAARKLRAFMISVPIIYILNLQRLAFTASAYGFGWFGTPDESFHISEHIITKAGSLMALFLISYVVLKTLPEVLDMIDGVLKIMRIEFHRLTAV
ncbi:MAG: archaeosortase A [Candidatus Methanoperedens sp.]|nr:archaeosortase A [Candidatus Methanoperedens sp.]